MTDDLYDKSWSELINEVKRLRAELDKFRSDDDLWKHAQEMGYEKVIDEQQQRITKLEAKVKAQSDYIMTANRVNNNLKKEIEDK